MYIINIRIYVYYSRCLNIYLKFYKIITIFEFEKKHWIYVSGYKCSQLEEYN